MSPNRHQLAILGGMTVILCVVSILRGIRAQSLWYLIAVPCLLAGAFLIFAFQSPDEARQLLRHLRVVRRVALWSVGLLVLLAGGVVVVRYADRPERLSIEDQIKLSGEAGVQTDGDFAMTLYNGSQKQITAVVIVVTKYDIGETKPSWTRRYRLVPEMGTPVAPLTSARFRATMVGLSPYDRWAWYIQGAEGR